MDFNSPRLFIIIPCYNEEEVLPVTAPMFLNEYYGAAKPPVRCGESHLSGLTEPPHFVY